MKNLLIVLLLIVAIFLLTPGDLVDTREERDNNILGVNKASPKREKQFIDGGFLVLNADGTPKMDGPLYIAKDKPSGLKMASLILGQLYFPNGWNTPSKIALKWTGNPTAYTGKDVAYKMGAEYSADTVLDWKADGAKLLYALAFNENDRSIDQIPKTWFQNAVDVVNYA